MLFGWQSTCSYRMHGARNERNTMSYITLLPPIFCDCCSTLALAELDTALLCERCLLQALDRSTDPRLFEKIRPLQLSGPSPRLSTYPPRQADLDEVA